jgi:pyruvate,water dikinase
MHSRAVDPRGTIARLLRSLKKIPPWGKSAGQGSTSTEDLRLAFKSRYHSFKLLLNANNKALEIMTDLEQAQEGTRPFGLSFIRANCTAVCVNVLKIIRHLDEISPGKYQALLPRFKMIQERINRAIGPKVPPEAGAIAMPIQAIDKLMVDEVGAKMANLGEIKNIVRLAVPDGFVITASGYQKFLDHNDLHPEISRRLLGIEDEPLDQLYRISTDLQQLIIRSPLPPELQQALWQMYRMLEEKTGKAVRVSMRSSALGEDLAGTSFAGQFRSELNVSPEHMVETYKEVVASKYSVQAIVYRLNMGIPDEDIDMCVGCMAMVDAMAGGVTYTRNPMNIRLDSVYIYAAWGLPKSVVEGTVTPDLFVVSRRDPPQVLRKEVRPKDKKFVCYPEEGVCRLDLTGEQANAPSLRDDQAAKLAGDCIKLEQYYGSPQDIEWVLDADEQFHILQCRPLEQVEVGAGILRPDEEELEDELVLLQGGITASPGAASGPVFILRRDADAFQFPGGAVLVTMQSLPKWAALLSRASAVVTEHGGAAGHLANVAREYGVPALFGLPDAADAFVGGEVVTVDADGHRIYQGRIESLLSQAPETRPIMKGTPVFEVLRSVSGHIVPLNLLAPDSPDFKPQRCQTLHDITRFCHEKSVQDMSAFGHEHRFPERSAKRLVCEVPMQWWVIDLDDGFNRIEQGKFIHLEHIASIPMLALWEGIIAIPWEGPPPVDTRGFVSVLMQSTTNPALDPAMSSEFAIKNYFMISKNYCSLNSRFGYHFSTVETLVSDRPLENYISFQFKGGAADYQRRKKRALLVGHILEMFDFHVEIREDAVFARLEGREEKTMVEKLKLLGYLIIHTRQLDMVMSNEKAFYNFKYKLITHLRSLLQNQDASPNEASNSLDT